MFNFYYYFLKLESVNFILLEKIFLLHLCFPTFLNDFCSMLKKLQEKWKVGLVRLVLILTTFALGGSLCGYAGRKLLSFTGMEKGALWFIVYIVLVTILWPLAVILVSIPLGQFVFFKNYLKKVWGRLSGKRKVD